MGPTVFLREVTPNITLQGRLSLVCIVSSQHVSCLHRSDIVWKYQVYHLCAVEHRFKGALARGEISDISLQRQLSVVCIDT